MLHWLYLIAGLNSANSPWYLFWSGIGADWTRLLAFGGLIHVARVHHRRHHNSPENSANERR